MHASRLKMRRRDLLRAGAAATTLAAGGCSSLPPMPTFNILLGRTPAAPPDTAAPAPAEAASAVAAAAPATVPPLRGLPPYAAWKDADSVIVHGTHLLETRRGALGTGIVTPLQHLFVRNNLPPPDESVLADRDAWTVAVEGVARPATLSLRELKSMGLETVAMVLQCSGNGRALYPGKTTGTPWTVGAAGCVVWSGVPLRVVAQKLGGVAERMVFITGTGGETLPEGVDPKDAVVERSVPIMALGHALLAWEMNGVPLPLAHGGPLRLVFPGYQGINNIKYVKRLAFTETESNARIMSHGYRFTPLGAQPGPGQNSVWETELKSWIDHPTAEFASLGPGTVLVRGVAFGGGGRPLKRVEVSANGGRNWAEARLTGPDLGPFAWRQFVLPMQLGAGTHTLVSRATDVLGNQQPERCLANVNGYNNTSWADHAVQVVVGPRRNDSPGIARRADRLT
jgi:sulfite oxidase